MRTERPPKGEKFLQITNFENTGQRMAERKRTKRTNEAERGKKTPQMIPGTQTERKPPTIQQNANF